MTVPHLFDPVQCKCIRFMVGVGGRIRNVGGQGLQVEGALYLYSYHRAKVTLFLSGQGLFAVASQLMSTLECCPSSSGFELRVLPDLGVDWSCRQPCGEQRVSRC